MSSIKANLKLVIKVTEKQIQYAPDLERKIVIEGKEYKVAVYINIGGASMLLSK